MCPLTFHLFIKNFYLFSNDTHQTFPQFVCIPLSEEESSIKEKTLLNGKSRIYFQGSKFFPFITDISLQGQEKYSIRVAFPLSVSIVLKTISWRLLLPFSERNIIIYFKSIYEIFKLSMLEFFTSLHHLSKAKITK